MNLGIDARPLHAPLSGIGKATLEIIKRLSQHKNIKLFLYTYSQLTAIPADLNIIARITPLPFFMPAFAGRLYWHQVILPKLIQQDNLDVFWSPRHHLPLFNCHHIPMVLTINDLVYRKFPYTMKLPNFIVEKLLLFYSTKRANHIVAISAATKMDLIKELKTPAKRITVIHLGYSRPTVDVSDKSTALTMHSPFILFLGTLDPRKNIERIVNAYLALPPTLKSQYKLVLAGGRGWIPAKLFRKIKHLHTNGEIKYLGYVDDLTAASLMEQATFLIFPSLYEGFGLPILEAMYANTPVLASQVSACQEVAGNAALYVDPLDTQAITEGMIQLLTDKSLRQTLSTEGRTRAQLFSWETASQQYLNLFLSLANSKDTV